MKHTNYFTGSVKWKIGACNIFHKGQTTLFDFLQTDGSIKLMFSWFMLHHSCVFANTREVRVILYYVCLYIYSFCFSKRKKSDTVIQIQREMQGGIQATVLEWKLYKASVLYDSFDGGS